ncbi:hypothetical protein GCM10009000_075420 [Halobacterium noricense]|uniref:Uncharacterized protein n=1 Tax=Haladaptatus pallidirubidus TaxID=1008152 RepID=A0AAV3UM81_9EURY
MRVCLSVADESGVKVKLGRDGEFDEGRFEESTLNRFEELIQAINTSLSDNSENTNKETEEVAADD